MVRSVKVFYGLFMILTVLIGYSPIPGFAVELTCI